jgi:hypothetical protein
MRFHSRRIGVKLEVKRIRFTDNSTIGELSVDGHPECYRLEDPVTGLRKFPRGPRYQPEPIE